MRFTGNGITNCYPDEVDNFVSITVLSADVAQLIYDARTNAGLSQKELAELIGTTQSVISRLEDSDYGGRSLTMLERIAGALRKKLTVTMTDLGRAGKREAFVGFDSAWGDQVPGAISWVTLVDGRFEAFGPPELVDFDEAARVVEERRADADYVLVALINRRLCPTERACGLLSGSRLP